MAVLRKLLKTLKWLPYPFPWSTVVTYSTLEIITDAVRRSLTLPGVRLFPHASADFHLYVMIVLQRKWVVFIQLTSVHDLDATEALYQLGQAEVTAGGVSTIFYLHD